MAGRVLAVINQKGGTGKTTLAVNLAGGLIRRGRTRLLDADPQASATQWASLAEAPGQGVPEVQPVAESVVDALERTREDAEYVVVDCPPHFDPDAARALMGAADTVLIPVLPSPMDLWGSVRLGEALEEARARKPGLGIYFLVNQMESRSALSRAMQHALAEFHFPTLAARVRRRAIYRHAALEGRTVYNLGRRGEAAVQELEAVLEEVLAT